MMMPNLVRTLFAVAAVIAVTAVPTGSIAATPLPQATAQQAGAAAATNPWLTLSAMTGNSSSAASAVAAAQDQQDSDFPPIPPLIVMLGTFALGVWILFEDGGNSGRNRGLDGGNGSGGTQRSIVDDFVGALTPTPQTPVSPA